MNPDVKNSNEEPILRIEGLNKFYSGGFQALKDINLEIQKGEIVALLGPNGAGKTTLISVVCGIVSPSSGSVTVDGNDIIKDFRKTRSIIGLVPQELTTDSFETVFNTVAFSRGLFGKPPNASYIEKVLRSLSLWDKKDNMIMTLSGGMKRRVLIAKALSHEPTVLFLDEPTAGVDVSLRKDMWEIVQGLKAEGVTIILTTHYIEEAEEIADRVGVINNGEIILMEEKQKLMAKLGKKQLILDLRDHLSALPESLADYELDLSEDGMQLIYTFNTQGDRTGITALIDDLKLADIAFRDLNTTQSSLEEIFVNLVEESS
jgi:ABC-2 type transport system ATP-binding protein